MLIFGKNATKGTFMPKFSLLKTCLQESLFVVVVVIVVFVVAVVVYVVVAVVVVVVAAVVNDGLGLLIER